MLYDKSILLAFFCIIATCSSLPDGWSACKQSSSKYEECLEKQINNAILYFKNGNRKMGIVSLDPLHFDSMEVSQGSGPVVITMNMNNVTFHGISDSRAIAVRNDWKKMFIKFHTPYSKIEGDYTGKGHVLMLPIYGTGNFFIEWENMDYTMDITFKQITKNGKKYFQVDKMPVDLSPQKVVIFLGNMFNGNKELGDFMNKFLNENWRGILEGMMPAISRTLEAGYKEYINRILSQIPAEEIDVK